MSVLNQNTSSMPSGSTIHICHSHLLIRKPWYTFFVPDSFVCPITIDIVFRKPQSRKREVFLFLMPSTENRDRFSRSRLLLDWKESTATYVTEAECFLCLRGRFLQCEAQRQLAPLGRCWKQLRGQADNQQKLHLLHMAHFCIFCKSRHKSVPDTT